MKKIILPVITLLAAYAAAENRLMLKVRHERIGKGIKIAHVSDLHKRRFGKDNSRLCEKIAMEKPDLIFISGDFVSRSEKNFSAAEKTLNKLCEIAPVYMIFGNHEQSISPEKLPEFLEMTGRTDVKLLRNKSERIKIKGRELNIFGLEESYSVYKKNDSYRNLDSITSEDMNELLGEVPDGETLLIAHNPFFGEAYAEWGADYTFSGHVHGGTMRIFGVGLLSPERKFFPRYSKGIYTFGKMKLLVSGGLGKPRMFNPPEIIMYEI